MRTKEFYITLPFTLLLIIMGMLILSAPAGAAQAIRVNDVNTGIVTDKDFKTGYLSIPMTPIFWRSDTTWQISVNSRNPDLGMSDDGTYIKPLSDFLWKVSDETEWMPLSQETEEIDWSSQVGEGVIYIDIKVLLDWLSDVPGQYSTDLVFTISAL